MFVTSLPCLVYLSLYLKYVICKLDTIWFSFENLFRFPAEINFEQKKWAAQYQSEVKFSMLVSIGDGHVLLNFLWNITAYALKTLLFFFLCFRWSREWVNINHTLFLLASIVYCIVRGVSKHITSINLLKSLQMDSKYHLIYSIFYPKKTTNSGKVKMLDFLIHDFDLTIYGALILHI